MYPIIRLCAFVTSWDRGALAQQAVPHGVMAAGIIQLVFDCEVLSGHHLSCHLPAPFEMRATPEDHAREPDLLFVAREHVNRLTEARLTGPADLVMEVSSDHSVAQDA